MAISPDTIALLLGILVNAAVLGGIFIRVGKILQHIEHLDDRVSTVEEDIESLHPRTS